MQKRRALITGVTGQDGTYLSKFLLSKGYEVYGVDAEGSIARSPLTDRRAIDVRDSDRLSAYLEEVRPHECYHLATFHRSSAVSNGDVDVAQEERISIETNVLSVHTILSTLQRVEPNARVFLAGSCHMFGEAREMPQCEDTPFTPTNIYAITKTAATMLGRLYREKHGLFVCTGILFNHESPLRSPDFVTARIAKAAADIARGRQQKLVLGKLDAQVDWGFAGDYVRAMHAMLSAEHPEDFVIASGILHRVSDFAEAAFKHVGLDWRLWVEEDSMSYQPVGRAIYWGDPSAIQKRLGWYPETGFADLVNMMVDHYMGQP